MIKSRIFSAVAIATMLAACAAPSAAPAPTQAPAPPKAADPTKAPAPTQAPAPTAAPAATKAPEPTKAPVADTSMNTVGKKLPDDAAPSDQQVIVIAAVPPPAGARMMDIMAATYNRGLGADLFAIPLVRLNKDFQVIPGSAASWSASADGKTWTFKIRPDLNWSDGTPVTAADWVASFQHITKKETAYDFGWYFEEANIKNFADAEAGKAKPEDIGVRVGASPKDLVIETTKSIPYLPMLFLYASPMQKAALEKSGPTYNSDPKTSVSAGPYVLQDWSENRVVVVANKNMPDDLKPLLNKVIIIAQKNGLQAYQAGEVDTAVAGSAADVKVITSDANLSKDSTQDPADFRVHYFFFDMSKPPFNNIKVRQAFAHLFDRDTIVKKILPLPAGAPMYGFLAPGFPDSNQEQLKTLQSYDPAMAKQLYADSGVKITDKLTLQVRTENAVEDAAVAMAQVYADEIKKQLGVEIEVKRTPQKTFMDALNAKPTKMDFGMISYGMDFLDPSNMLSVFKPNGRHNWNNDKYAALLDQAGPETDIAKRDQVYKDAEKLLVTEAPGIFAFQQFNVNLWRPYLNGVTFQPGKVNTARGIGWPGFSSFNLGTYDTYVTKDVLKTRPNPPK